MGIFSKSRSVGANESNVRESAVEKRKWRSSVRSYLCGDEFNSVLAEEDSASVRSSEVTVTQPMPESSQGTIIQNQQTLESSEATVTQTVPEEFTDKGENVQRKEIKDKLPEEKQNSTARLFLQEDAALVIQAAFKGYLARHQNRGIKSMDGEQELLVGGGTPSRESLGTSIEVQTGNSTEVFSTREEIMAIHHRLQQKARTAALKLKEDWDDSTVSSNITKMRIQNRLEATTRRERALAYAYSQQLRICSKKKHNRSDGTKTNMGWSWLERWMATRLPESSSFESFEMSQFELINVNQRPVVKKRFLDLAGEEKESCGSNEVSVQFDSISVSAPREKYDSKSTKNRLKATRSISRRKTVPSYNCPREHSQVSKKDCPGGDETDKKNTQKQAGTEREIKCKHATSQLSPEVSTSNYSKLGN
ncbi:Protein IQ-DOMAIN like [Actinidia chinensis var. chinensis]|uniref:Protein IQ-DOMAIN like n=1 Tax=Actinidia chinensis var. chinensis TaxID=1590841 RepID=A0A2R6QTB1_ACTCC|nr:Protein IQ-DOMAIN like [Actinidia chinensis var. chinensis]